MTSTPDPHSPTVHVLPSQLTLVVVPVRSAWQSVFAPEPVQERPAVLADPARVIIEYVKPALMLERKPFQSVQDCVVFGTMPTAKLEV